MVRKFSKSKLLVLDEEGSDWKRLPNSKDLFKIYRTGDTIALHFRSMKMFNLPLFEHAYYLGKVVFEDMHVLEVDGRIVIPVFNKITIAFSFFVLALLCFTDTKKPLNGIAPFLIVSAIVFLNFYVIFKRLIRNISALV